MNRVVSLLPSSTEIIHALGCGERIVGRSHECDYPAGIESLPPCTAPKFDPNGTSREIDERVKAVLQEAVSVYSVDTALLDELAPDLVVTQSQCELCAVSLADVQAAVRELVRSKPDVLSLEPNALEDVWHDVASVANALGVRERGEALLAELRERLGAIAGRARERGRKPRVACIEWYDPLMAAGNWVPELVEIAGGVDVLGVTGEHSAWLEWTVLEEAKPEVIALMPCGFDIARSRRELVAFTGRAGVGALRGRATGRSLRHGRQPVLQPPRTPAGRIRRDTGGDSASRRLRLRPRGRGLGASRSACGLIPTGTNDERG